MKDDSRRNLAIIPARGGSKRLPGKNISLLNDKPLICYTIEAAIQSRCYDHILFSSDDDDFLAIAAEYREVAVEKRPASLSGDTVKVIDLVCTIVDRPETEKDFDTVSLLLPTCPFRRPRDIRKGFQNLTPAWDSVVSVTPFEFPITMSMHLEEQTRSVRYVFDPSPLVTGNTRSQDHETVYRPNGAFYISWTKRLAEQRNYFRGRVRGVPMPREYSVDIDEKQDLLIADTYLKNNVVQLCG